MATKDTTNSSNPTKDTMLAFLAEITAAVESGVIETPADLKGELIKSVSKIK